MCSRGTREGEKRARLLRHRGSASQQQILEGLKKVEEGFPEARPEKEAQIGRRFNSQQDERLKVGGERQLEDKEMNVPRC